VYAWGFQPENATFPSSYIPTTTAAVTRAVDAGPTYTYLPAPQAQTWYSKIVEPTTPANQANNRVWEIGDGSGALLSLMRISGGYRLTHNNGSTAVTADVSVTVAAGNIVELLAWLYADGSVQLSASVNSAAAIVGTQSAANTLAAAWHATKFSFHQDGGATNPDFSAAVTHKNAANVQSFSVMRAA
jgi:hypothetical protein